MPFFRQSVPPYILKHLLEKEAQRLRAHLGFGSDEPIGALEVAEMLGLKVVSPAALRYLSPGALRFLLGAAARDWSGLACHLPNGIVAVVLNPTHSERRRRATLMEEVGHLHLGHRPSAVTVDAPTGLMRRTYDKRQEDEAYWFGGAMLVPKTGLRALLGAGWSLRAAADFYGVSDDLVTFRANLHGLRRQVQVSPGRGAPGPSLRAGGSDQ